MAAAYCFAHSVYSQGQGRLQGSSCRCCWHHPAAQAAVFTWLTGLSSRGVLTIKPCCCDHTCATCAGTGSSCRSGWPSMTRSARQSSNAHGVRLHHTIHCRTYCSQCLPGRWLVSAGMQPTPVHPLLLLLPADAQKAAKQAIYSLHRGDFERAAQQHHTVGGWPCPQHQHMPSLGNQRRARGTWVSGLAAYDCADPRSCHDLQLMFAFALSTARRLC